MKEIIVATKNKGKAKEFQTLFAPYNIEAKSLLDLTEHIPVIAETGDTFSENARIKAETISKIVNRPVIADDSGIVIDALDGKPGVFSARYAGERASDQDNIQKVLDELEGVPSHNRTARFVCVLAIYFNGDLTFYSGYCEGKIALKAVGSNGFGYDPIFIPEGYTKTMAELTDIEKNKISHRYDAFKKLEQWLKQKKSE